MKISGDGILKWTIFIILLYFLIIGGTLKNLFCNECFIVNFFIIFFGIIYYFLKREKKVISPLDVSFFFFIIIISVNFILNKNYELSASGYFWILSYVFIYYFTINFIKDQKMINSMLIFFIIISFISSLYGLLQFIFILNLYSFNINKYFSAVSSYQLITRVWSFFNHPNIFADFIIIIIPINFILIFLSSGFKKMLYLLNIFLLFILLFLSFSRGAYIAICFVICFFSIFYLKKFGIIKSVKIPAGILIISIIWLVGLTMLKPQQPRFKIWRDTIYMIKNKPIFGYGLNTYQKYFLDFKEKDTEFHKHSHNIILQISAEGGLLYLFSFLWIFISYFRAFIRSDFEIINIALAGSITGFLIHNLFDYLLNIPMLGILVFIILGLSVNMMKI